MNSTRLTLEWLPGRYAVCSLPPESEIPTWAASAALHTTATPRIDPPPARQSHFNLTSITRTDRELSIVIDESLLPQDSSTIKIERNFVALRIEGTLDFSLIGVLSKLTGALADAMIPAFAISTYQTDVLLIRSSDGDRAAQALRQVAFVSAI